MNANPPKKRPAIATNEPEDLESQVRLRAYELYEARGRGDGHDIEDWLQAETDLAEEKVRPIAA